jgi:hypothetical protein
MLVKHTSDCRSNRWSHIRDLVLIQFRAALVINVVCFSNWTWWAIIWVVIMILIVTWSTVNTAIKPVTPITMSISVSQIPLLGICVRLRSTSNSQIYGCFSLSQIDVQWRHSRILQMTSHPLGNVSEAMMEKGQDIIPDEGFLMTKDKCLCIS